MLIWVQHQVAFEGRPRARTVPHARGGLSAVAGAGAWVMKGQPGYMIFAPAPGQVRHLHAVGFGFVATARAAGETEAR